jgi:hypothetical protein
VVEGRSSGEEGLEKRGIYWLRRVRKEWFL